MKRMVLCWVTSFVAALVLTAAPQDAHACGKRREFVHRSPPAADPKLENVRKAEAWLAEGNHQRAIKYARRAFPNLEQLPAEPEVSPLFDRAQRVAAMATVHAHGNVDVGNGLAGDSEQERAVNRMWAAFVMQHQHARHRDNVVVEVQYAQAVAHVDGLEGQAYAMLERLATEDLMPTAGGYLTLARLQTHRGDARGRDTSLARCREIAGTNACDLA